MVLKTTVRAVIYPETLHAGCSKAAHAVAVQAERDCRPYIPSATGKLRSSGKVTGRVITWDMPYARMLYFGHVYVDPKYMKGGFDYPNLGIMRSRKGIKKVRTARKFNVTMGEDQWFKKAKDANLEKWVNLAQGVIARG